MSLTCTRFKIGGFFIFDAETTGWAPPKWLKALRVVLSANHLKGLRPLQGFPNAPPSSPPGQNSKSMMPQAAVPNTRIHTTGERL